MQVEQRLVCHEICNKPTEVNNCLYQLQVTIIYLILYCDVDWILAAQKGQLSN